jgi:hypothetical protein
LKSKSNLLWKQQNSPNLQFFDKVSGLPGDKNGGRRLACPSLGETTMPPELPVRHILDSLEALHFERAAGYENLAAWLSGLQSSGDRKVLFQLETWLKSLRSFFDFRHFPLGEIEKAGLLQRDFAPEMRLACKAIEMSERCASNLIQIGRSVPVSFERYRQFHIRKGKSPDFQVGRKLEPSSPADSLAKLIESLNDFRVMLEALGREKVTAQLFLAAGRSLCRDLKNCRHVDILMTQRFRPEYDQVQNAAAAGTLRSIPDERVRCDVTISLLHAHRLLRYLKVVAQEIGTDRPVRHVLVIYSLVHEECIQLADHLKNHLQKRREAGPDLRNISEYLACSLFSESKRLLDRILAGVSRNSDLGAVHSSLESGCELMRNSMQSCILGLLLACNPDLDPSALFPPRPERIQESEKVRRDLWQLRQSIKSMLDRREELESHRIVEQISLLGETSLRYLMSRDWEEFERFSDAVVTGRDRSEIRALLRNFITTLENLIGDISLRDATFPCGRNL